MTMRYPLSVHRLVLFGGQGSPSIFSANAANIAEQDAQSVSAGNILLSKCHAAFLEEIASLDARSRYLLSVQPSLFTSPRDLLKPAAQYHTHPVLQATTIYLCQLLRYLAETLGQDEVYEHSFDALEATAGFSSGILPAAVVARSRSLYEFVECGVQGFRLAFSIACYSHLWTLESTGDAGDEVGGYFHSGATFSLVIRGLSRAQVEQRLSHHYVQGHDPGALLDAQQRLRGMRISAISGPDTISVSGPKAELGAFQAELQSTSGLTTTFAFVHGWYHGGDQLEAVVQRVLEHLRRRDIAFPPSSTPTKPIHSTLDGRLLNGSITSADEIMVGLTRHLLVHCVNWSDTAHDIAANVRSLLQRDPGATINILSYGPSSGSLFPDLTPLDSRVALFDLSPFKAGRNTADISSNHQNDIAIVGMGVQLPKGKDTEELWKTISQGLNATQEIPESRFQLSDLYLDDTDKAQAMHIKHGAFLENPFSFDNSFFNISPREAKSMDPQQRVLLHVAKEALEDAGYVQDSSPSFQRATIGCYIGLATGDYTDNLRNEIDAFYSPGTLRAFHSGRISYFFRLSGPSIVTDTACSSSAVSIYHACRALQNGDCTAAIAGGVNVITSPDMYIGLARGHFLSRTGCCKPFDATADGYCRAEGCALFVLKRLSDAVAEGDRIHGVIRDVLINQSGNSNSITHPHSQTQTDLLQRLLQQTGVDPASVDVVEAHGTGTQAGDTREVETLRAVFGPHHSATNPLMVSSVKGNIGHCEAASGAAGLAKLLLMLREKEIPIQTGLSNINPAFGDLQSSGLVIPRRTVSWRHSKRTPRRAVLNNFGAAGSNASLLLEDWVESPNTHMQQSKQNQIQERSAYVFLLSSKSEKALKSAVSRHIEFLGNEKRQPSLVDICYTATARRHHYDHRISLACSSVADLLAKLHRYESVPFKPAQSATATVFAFTGQGALYRGMGQELMSSFPPFRDIIMNCDRIIQGLGLGCPSILNYILYRDEGGLESLTDIEQDIVSQCACIAVEYALARIFMSWNIIPDYVTGHSLGEYAALCVSGALTLEDTFRVVAFRAKVMGDNCLANTSGMLACNLAPEKIAGIISESPALTQLTIACFNGPGDCVVGGPLAQLDTFQKDCKARKIRTKLINAPYAFHTSAMDPVLESLRALGRSVRFGQPVIPVISNVNGRLFQSSFSSDYFADHARQPVRFTDGLRSLQLLMGQPVLDGALFLEIGPQPTLLPILQASIHSSSSTYLGTLKKGRCAWTSLSETLAAISLRKTAVKWREVFTGTSAKVTTLPGHLLEGSNFLTPFQDPRQVSRNGCHQSTSGCNAPGRLRTGYQLLPWLDKDGSLSGELLLKTNTEILGTFIKGHNVGGTPICPASVFHELAIEATQILLEPPEDQVLIVSGMNFCSPLVDIQSSRGDAPLTVSVRVTKEGSFSAVGARFRITSCSSTRDSVENLHCTGSVSVQNISVNTSHWMRDQAVVARQSCYFSGAGKDHMSTFRTKVLYDAIFTRVVSYAPEYQTLVYLNVADSNLEGIGSFEMPSGSDSQTGYLVPPIFTDTLLHGAGFIANLAVRSGEICICVRVESIEIAYRDIDFSDSFRIYCSLLEIKGAIHADAIALGSSGKVVAVVRGMEFKKLRHSTFQQALSRISSTVDVKCQSRNYVQYPTAALAKPQPQTSLDTPLTSDDVMAPSTEPCSGSQSHAGTSKVLKEIVMEVGGFAEQDLDYSKPLGDLGIDSLMQIEITSKLARYFPGQTGVRHYDLSQCETLEAMDDMLSSILQPSVSQQPLNRTLLGVSESEVNTKEESCSQNSTDASTSSSTECSSPVYAVDGSNILPTTLHVSTGNQTPLFLFHDGSGQVSMYSRLRGHDRTTYAFFDPYFGSSDENRRPHRSVNKMAESYISTILSNPKHRSAPLILGGWSFGGIVAFEAAQQLLALGIEVKGLVLIDSPSPVDHQPLPAAIISSITKANCQGYSPSGSIVALEEEFLSNASLLETYKPKSLSEATEKILKTVMLRSKDVVNTEALWGVRYDWLSRQDIRNAALATWEKLVGDYIEVLPIPGNHFEPFLKDKIDETATQLWKACRYIEESGQLSR